MNKLSTLLLCAVLSAQAFSSKVHAIETELSAAHGYVETTDGKVGAVGINIPSEALNSSGRPQMNNTLSAWTSTSVCAVYYFHHPAATVSNTLKLNIKALQTVRFRLTVSAPNSPATPLYTKEFSAKGPFLGGEVEVGMGDITFTRSAYYRYKLECLSGNNAINNISRFKFSTSSSEASYAANYLSSPSVHLNNWHTTAAGAPSGDGYDWLFEEIMIPAESDLVGTYAEAIGALNGYMGIQMNG